MKNYKLAERYALGLMRALPDEPQALEDAAQALRDQRRMYEKSPDLQIVLQNPAYTLQKRLDVLDEILLASQAPQSVANLVRTLLKRGRIAMLTDVSRVFSRLVDAHLNRANVTVHTAAELDPEQEQRVKLSLEKFTGLSVRCDFETDPHLLGGVVARVGDLLIDGSLRTRLHRLKDALLPEERMVE